MARIPQSCIFDYLLLKYKQNVHKILVSRLSTNLKKKKNPFMALKCILALPLASEIIFFRVITIW